MHLAEYLFRRIHQLNIRAVFGVPGDFNLTCLDYVEECGLDWVGNVNELNAGESSQREQNTYSRLKKKAEHNEGYAADGYARVKGISALATTFGVGELSALNAIAGACAELVPIIHIVGFPSSAVQEKKLPVHHTLGDGDYELFMKMSERVSSATILMKDPLKATKMIDDTIIECYRSSKPVFIGFPMDLVKADIDPSPLETPLLLHHSLTGPTSADETAVKTILERLLKAQKPVIIVDSLAGRYEGLHATRTFVEKSNMPCFAFPMAKGIIDESLPKFRGIYAGNVSNPGVQEEIQSSDLILLIGPRPTDLNTGGFKSDVSDVETIVFHRNTVQIADITYADISMGNVLEKLSESVCASVPNSPSDSSTSSPRALSSPASSVALSSLSLDGHELPQEFQGKKLDANAVVTQEWIWPRLSAWLEEDDIIAMDIGTSAFGGLWCKQPRGAQSLFQLLWSSIGFALGATVGAAIAAREQLKESKTSRKRRTILFTGDGSLQMTAQEISTLVRKELGVIIFVICNEGYTIERYIHGWDSSYNDIQPWDYKLLPLVFNPKPDFVRTYSVRTKGELEMLLTDDSFGPAGNFHEGQPEPLRLVEVHMDKFDAPQTIPDMITDLHGKVAK
ncbi:Thiamine pyrophosphate enzyme C-terminal TPP-binding [Penicillium verhagenii]|uniref:Thiamine pyrophosphate enzyme C-terminal TPP-binding n=1 Tax=Penicillium verhagenii TaxID=1562060 RepID=UPI0025454635|nr:Thiamine pyrophosphate enzyme C-terminal TPP-binding [Penicillium verhagenii]KAJ5948139.1 Thiamine pyrophosphate enzyme C-terminal TPP-binding [Penicillium verhagenii]